MQKILVANRGEIALRIMKTIRKMGKKSVAVFSEADRNAPHVLFADEAVYIGKSPSAESYLCGDRIIEKALELGVDGIHPGYGFLSENAEFARKVKNSGITFIGPSPESMEIMGSKLAAKDAVSKYNIPMVPGTGKAIDDIAAAKEAANRIGYPVLIKASAGGGGKGMRIVETENSFEEQMDRSISEAISAFGDGSVFIEKYVSAPRHIEIQVLADNHGNTIHLFERECSIQRRHQKVIEEAPSSILSESLRSEMGEAAVKVAKSCGYSGAGTVEFLVDENLNYYFLEMNTRLQVEHPVTELITGIDLVEQQIKIAENEVMSISQGNLKIHGHAIELRVYAEDPLNNFLPSIGRLETYIRPSGDGIRVDDGYEAGMDVPIYYDPMLAKLSVHAPTRTDAIEKIKSAISAYRIEGVANTLQFGQFVFAHPSFISGRFDTNFISKYFNQDHLHEVNSIRAGFAAKFALKAWLDETRKTKIPVNNSDGWKTRKKTR